MLSLLKRLFAKEDEGIGPDGYSNLRRDIKTQEDRELEAHLQSFPNRLWKAMKRGAGHDCGDFVDVNYKHIPGSHHGVGSSVAIFDAAAKEEGWAGATVRIWDGGFHSDITIRLWRVPPYNTITNYQKDRIKEHGL